MSFPQFAFNNVLRNARAYLSFFLSSTFMVMIFFSYSVFMYHPAVDDAGIWGLGSVAASSMKTGSYIVFIFAFFFILYSVSAFMKLRNLEFGILMILGARSGQINRMILLESMLIGLFSIITGITFGMLLSKLFLLLSTTVIGMDKLPFYWPVKALIFTSVSFTVLFLVISIFTLLFIRKNQVLDLLTGSSKPKKAPKASWLFSMIGLAFLTTGVIFTRMPVSENNLRVAAVTLIPGIYSFYSQLSAVGMSLLKLSRKRLWRGTNLLWISEMSFKIKDNVRMLFFVTVLTAVACIASGVLLAFNQGIRTDYLNNPFAFSYTYNNSQTIQPGLEFIHEKLKLAGVKYTENKTEFIADEIYIQNSNDYQFVTMLSLSQYNKLAPQMNVAVIAPLSGNEAVMIVNPSHPSPEYKANQTILSKNQNELSLTLKEVQMDDVQPFFGANDRFLIVNDALYEKFRTTAVREGASYYSYHVNNLYLYKIPAWDGPPPAATAPEAILAAELDKWNFDSHNVDSFIHARATTYVQNHQAIALFSFIGVFIALIFSLSSASFLYFKLHNDLNADRKMYHALSKMGLSVKEMSASATRQIALLFFIPIIVAMILMLVVVPPVLNDNHVPNGMTSILLTSAAFVAVQTVYFVIARSRYIRSLKKIML